MKKSFMKEKIEADFHPYINIPGAICFIISFVGNIVLSLISSKKTFTKSSSKQST